MPKFLLSLLLVISLCGLPALCTTDSTSSVPKKDDKPVTVYEDEEDPDAEPNQKIIDQSRVGTGLVRADIFVSQLAPVTVRNYVSSATAYPWPPRPPKVRYNPAPLPTDEEPLKMKIEYEGYSNRTSNQDPYPQGGWRWQFAFRRAMKKSGATMPHSLIGMNGFISHMMKYVRTECEKVNAFEETRIKAFNQVEEFFTENEKTMKNEAVQKNINPIQLKRIANHKSIMSYAQKLPAGKWWVQVEHKMPGLVFHWYQPVVIEADKTTQLRLTESNAISIEGGW